MDPGTNLPPAQPSETESLVGESLHVFTSSAGGEDLLGKSQSTLELFLLVTFVQSLQHPRLLIGQLPLRRHYSQHRPHRPHTSQAGISLNFTVTFTALTAPLLRLNNCCVWQAGGGQKEIFTL